MYLGRPGELVPENNIDSLTAWLHGYYTSSLINFLHFLRTIWRGYLSRTRYKLLAYGPAYASAAPLKSRWTTENGEKMMYDNHEAKLCESMLFSGTSSPGRPRYTAVKRVVVVRRLVSRVSR